MLLWTRILAIVAIAVGLAQGILLFFQSAHTGRAAAAANTNAKAVILAERAYVDMSHVQPGLIVGPNPGPNGMRDIFYRVAVRNMGETPARVIDANVFPWHTALPGKPPHGTRAVGSNGAFLVKTKKCFVSGNFAMPEVYFQAAHAGTKLMWLLGYVEYIDTFDKRHRCLYARRYEGTSQDLIAGIQPDKRPNNLVFEGKPGYNDDRDLG